MDDVQETELHEACAGLGNWHEIGDKSQYLVNRDEGLSCLRDLQINLKQDTQESGYAVHLKLGDWKVLPDHLVPLFTSYREDSQLSFQVLKVLVQLTKRCDLLGGDQLRQLKQLQDYKEAFAKKDVFIILMGMLVENMEEDEAADAPAKENRSAVFNLVLTLLRNLVSVPDPAPGDAGYTPTRRQLQSVYIKHFHDEGVLDFFLLFAEGLAHEKDAEQKAWALADIIYNICCNVDPEQLTKGNVEKDKNALRDLLNRDFADQRLRAPVGSRHSRFGTAMISRTAEGASSLVSSVVDTPNVSKGKALTRREFHDPHARNEKKQNMFHDPFFMDLEEGSVRDHNVLNAKIKSTSDIKRTIPGVVIEGLQKFFEEFLQNSFSSLVHTMRSTLGPAVARPGEVVDRPGGIFDRPKLLNFLAWFLEFHRHHYATAVAKAKAEKKETPVIDIAAIQGAIDLDMIQFTASRLREYGKDANFHTSHLVVTLRALAQQVRTVDKVMDSKDNDTRDCGEILMQNMIKDNIMAHIAWIFKNFKSTSHDPRILSYSVEAFHYMLKLMKTLSDRKGQTLEFQVEAVGARTTKRSVTTMDQEVSGLADARVVENLFHLLEKYKLHSAHMNSILVKLIYAVIRARRENIVVFFELTYFLRIQRIWADPLVRDKKQGKRYQEMVILLQYILRQFFKCAETNHCVYIELLFRKVPENQKDALLESHTAEFSAILDNYENEDYRKILEQMRAGETLNAMKSRQRALQQGTLPWTEAEDKILRERYQTYADHPLCAELLASELPADTQRTGAKVRKRLVELGLVVTGPRGRITQQPANPPRFEDFPDIDDLGEPPQKKSRTTDDMEEAFFGAASQVEDTLLEEDLERILDEAMDSQLGNSQLNQSQPQVDKSLPKDLGHENLESLEMALESLLDEDLLFEAAGDLPDDLAAAFEPAAAATAAAATAAPTATGTPQQQPSQQAAFPSQQPRDGSAAAATGGAERVPASAPAASAGTSSSDFEASREFQVGVAASAASSSSSSGGGATANASPSKSQGTTQASPDGKKASPSPSQKVTFSQEMDFGSELERMLGSQLEKDPEVQQQLQELQAAKGPGNVAPDSAKMPSQEEEVSLYDMEMALESLLDGDSELNGADGLGAGPPVVEAR